MLKSGTLTPRATSTHWCAIAVSVSVLSRSLLTCGTGFPQFHHLASLAAFHQDGLHWEDDLKSCADHLLGTLLDKHRPTAIPMVASLMQEMLHINLKCGTVAADDGDHAVQQLADQVWATGSGNFFALHVYATSCVMVLNPPSDGPAGDPPDCPLRGGAPPISDA